MASSRDDHRPERRHPVNAAIEWTRVADVAPRSKECTMDNERDMQFAEQLIGKVAARLARLKISSFEDVDDYRQDLMADLWERFPHFDEAKGHLRAFITVVVLHREAATLAAKAAIKRGGRASRTLSLNEECKSEDGEVVERHETVSVDDYLRRTRGPARTEEARRDLAIDLRAFVAGLAPIDRAACDLLMDANPCQVARVLDMPRSTLRDRIARLERLAEEFGLREYLD